MYIYTHRNGHQYTRITHIDFNMHTCLCAAMLVKFIDELVQGI